MATQPPLDPTQVYSPAPAPDVTAAPAPDVTAAPAPDVTAAPAPDVTAAPAPPDLVDQIAELTARVTAIDAELVVDHPAADPSATLGAKVNRLFVTIFGSADA